MRSHKSRCPVCRRAMNPKRPCPHSFDRPPLPILHLPNGNGILKLHPIPPRLNGRS